VRLSGTAAQTVAPMRGATGHPEGQRPRVLLVLPWDLGPIGGVNAVVANLYERFAFHGEFEPIVLVNRWEDKTPVALDENGYRKVRLRIRSPLERGGILRSLVAYLLTLPLELLKVRRLVRDLRVTVVNAHYPTLALLTVALARRLGFHRARLVLSLHGTDIHRAGSGGRISKFLWRRLLEEADAVVAVSAGLASVAGALAPKALHTTQVVHNGIDAGRFIADASREPARNAGLGDRRVVVSIGAFDRNKGHDVLLRAFSRVASRHEDLHLVIIGQTAPDLANLEHLVVSLGLSGRCTLIRDASREEVAGWLAAATAFVLASRSEGFGLVLLEAGAFGVPVIATRVGGIPEIIAGPEYGLLVEPDDPGALESALEDLLQNAEKARVLGENLRRRVRTVFSWEAAYKEYRNILDDRGVPAANGG
jgi:glycosyltransferase involved in cell wall biosynthesis